MYIITARQAQLSIDHDVRVEREVIGLQCSRVVSDVCVVIAMEIRAVAHVVRDDLYGNEL